MMKNGELRRLALALGAAALSILMCPLSAAMADGCPNAALRAQSSIDPVSGSPFSVALPDCRAFEQVSPTVKAGLNASMANGAVSDDGNAVMYQAGGAFADAESNRNAVVRYLARRTGSGWQTQALVLPSRVGVGGLAVPMGYTSDFGKVLFGQFLNSGDANGTTVTGLRFVIREPDGTYTQASPDMPASASAPAYIGGAPDMSRIFFTVGGRALPGETGSGSAIYEIEGAGSASPAVHRVDVDNAGTPISSAGINAALVSTEFHLVSDDGSAVFFTAGPNSNAPGSLYVRRFDSDGSATTTTITPLGSTFRAGSADGSRAIFTSAVQLASSDTDSSSDLYEYDSRNTSGQELVQMSTGPESANVLGLVRSSDDASRAYFVATGALTSTPNPQGQTPVTGADNLYLAERIRDSQGTVHSRTAFVGMLCSGANVSGSVADPGCGATDSALWGTSDSHMAQASVADGRYLVFSSFARLTADDTDNAQDVYRYDARTGQMTRASHAADGFGTDGNSSTAANAAVGVPQFATGTGTGPGVYTNRNRSMSDDGSVIVFLSAEALASGDDNAALDAYEWHADAGASGGGTVSLITSGHDKTNLNTGIAPAMTDPAGKNVFIGASDALVSQDNDSGLRDVYVARIDGGFPAAVPPVICHDDCQPAPTLAPALDAPNSGAGTPPSGMAPAAPTFTVQAVSAKQRRALSKTGKLTLTVSASDAGLLRATATGTLSKKTTRVASAATTIAGPGAAPLTLALSKKARSALAATGKLTVKVVVAYSKSATAHRVTLKLTHAKTKAKARTKAKAKAKKRAAGSKKGGRS